MGGLRHIPANQRSSVAERRLANNTQGLGYWAAVDYAIRVMQDSHQRIRAEREATLLRNEQRRLEMSNNV